MQSGVTPRNTTAVLRVNIEAPGFPPDPLSAVQTGVFPGSECSVWCVDCNTWQIDCNFQYSPCTLAVIPGCLTAYSRLQKGNPALALQPDLCFLLCWTIPLDLSQAYFQDVACRQTGLTGRTSPIPLIPLVRKKVPVCVKSWK